jgi:DNA-binding XRE family transcriptional regulator
MKEPKVKEVAVYVTLHSYLNRLREYEQSKPKERRRRVPSIAQLATDIGMSRQAVHNIAKGEIEQLNLTTAGKIIAAMRRRGFEMDVGDLLAYRGE